MMPKGIYDRAFSKPRPDGCGGHRTWMDEHDEALRDFIARGRSYSQVVRVMREKFPGKEFTRSGCIGRAHRLGIIATRKSGGRVGVSKPRKVKRQEMFRRVGKPALARAMAPVVFKRKNDMPLLLREEGDKGASNLPSRKLGLNDPALEERRKGRIPCIVEEKPLTTVAVAVCESDSCMWPTSEDPTCLEVCGAKVEAGSYCRRHAQVAYRVMPTKRRNSVHGKDDVEHAKRIDGSHHRRELDRDGEWLSRMILDEVVTAPADEPPLEIPHFIGSKS